MITLKLTIYVYMIIILNIHICHNNFRQSDLSVIWMTMFIYTTGDQTISLMDIATILLNFEDDVGS